VFTPVAVLVMATDAFGITAPVGSVTVPDRFAPTDWAWTAVDAKRQMKRTTACTQLFRNLEALEQRSAMEVLLSQRHLT
jgi:hypothetical protein